MALVTRIKEWREVPHEPGNEFRFQKLSDRQLEDAEQVRSSQVIAKLNEYGEGTLRVIRQESRAQLLEDAGVDEEKLEQAQADPLTGFDRHTLLRHGLIDWRGPEYEDALNDDARKALDRETSTWAATEILRMSVPELFGGEDDGPGNGAGESSSASSMSAIDLTGPVNPDRFRSPNSTMTPASSSSS